MSFCLRQKDHINVIRALRALINYTLNHVAEVMFSTNYRSFWFLHFEIRSLLFTMLEKHYYSVKCSEIECSNEMFYDTACYKHYCIDHRPQQ